MRFMRAVLVLGFLLAVVFLPAPYFLLQFGPADEFKAVAEAKVGEFLNAKVHIRKIHVRFLDQIVLSGLEIEGSSSAAPSFMRVDQILFRYNLFRLLTRNLKAPSAIVLKDPQFSLDGPEFPYAFFDNLRPSLGASRGSDFELVGGEFRSRISGVNSEILFKDITGSIKSTESGKIKVSLRTFAQGAVSGRLRVQGEIDPLNQTHHLTFALKSLDFESASFTSVDSISGQLRLVNGDLFFDDLKMVVQGWHSELDGSFERLFGTLPPRIRVEWNLGKNDSNLGFNMDADFRTGSLQAEVSPLAGPVWKVEGKVRKEGTRIFLDDLTTHRGIRGKGVADYKSGKTQFQFEKGSQRINLNSDLKDFNFHTELFLNHVKMYGLDWTTSMSVDLSAPGPHAVRQERRFRGAFRSHYFILEYTPFEDFKGSFEIAPSGVKKLSSAWGNVFRMEGDIPIRHGQPEARLTVHVDGLDLRQVQEFAARPVPKNLAGRLDGKLKVEGPLRHPEVIGNFNVKNGRIGRLDFDRCIIRFRGFAPFLPLSESRIFRGRSTFHLVGVLDLSLRNILNGIEVQTQDKMVIWKGWEFRGGEHAQMEIQPAFSKFTSLVFKAGGASVDPTSGEGEAPPSEERYVAVGPKFKF